MDLNAERESRSIRQVAKLTGLSAHTLRYYERVGLLDVVPRGAGGHRRYRPVDLEFIDFIARLRATGMPIRGIREYADLYRLGDTTLRARRELVERHRDDLRGRLVQLNRDLRAIEVKIAHFHELEARHAKGGGHAS